MIRPFIIAIFLLIVSVSDAQEFIFEKSDNLKTLPSLETYKIAQDGRGYIWFSTDAGLCRYNGEEIKIFGAAEGLPEEGCYVLEVDKHGDLWAVTSENRVVKVEGDKVIEAPFSKQVASFLNAQKIFAIGLEFMKHDSSIYIISNFSSYMVDRTTNKVYEDVSSDPLAPIAIIKDDDNHFIFQKRRFTKEEIIKIERDKFFCVNYISKGKIRKFKISKGDHNRGGTHRSKMIAGNNGKSYMILSGEIAEISDEGTCNIFSLPGDHLNAFVDSENGLWLGTIGRGVTYFKDCDLSNPNPIRGLSNLSVSCIAEDKQGNIWCTTIEDGVYLCKNRNLEKIAVSNSEKKDPLFFQCFGDSIVTFIGLHDVKIITPNRSSYLERKNYDFFYVTDLNKINNRWYLCSKKTYGVLDENFNNLKEFYECKIPSLRNPLFNKTLELNYSGKKKIVACHFFGFYEECQPDLFDLIKLNTNAEIKGMLQSTSGEVLIYTSDLLYKYNPIDHSLRELAKLSNIIKPISYKGKLWILTKNDGIMNYENGHVSKLEMPYKNAKLHDIAIDKKGQLWVASNIGIIYYLPDSDGEKWGVFNQDFGLPPDAFNKIQITNSDVVFASNNELFRFASASMLAKKEKSIPFILREISVSGKKTDLTPDGLKLDYNSSSVVLNFDVLDFKADIDKPIIRYTIGSGDTNNIEGRQIVFERLGSKDYTFSAYLVDSSGKKISQQISFNIIVAPPFWRTWPAIILFLTLFVVIVVLVSALVIRRIRKREEEKTRVNKMLSDYRMSALRAQMNPHFIFNCINSIQRYVLTNKTQDAYDYLAKFSKLIREVLNLSEENMITLKQELEIVELYIQMEQVRYEGYFDYEIYVSEEIDTSEVFIPSLLLQPYIENGIWHGIMNLKKSRQGMIRLHVSAEGNDLKVVIEDNGVGREVAAQQKLAGHKSKALGINKQRMELVQEMNKGIEASVTIIDLFDEKKQPLGTRVVIIIPQILEDE